MPSALGLVDIYLPIVGKIYPISEYIPPIVGRIYPISEYFPNCWQNISNTRIYPIQIYIIYIQLFIYSYSPIVGSIYPIQIYEIQSAAKKNSGAQFAT